MIPLRITINRKLFKRCDDRRDSGLSTPSEIERFDNIEYGAGPDYLLDVYRPKCQKGKLPVIVSVHGGGWSYGDKERYQYYCMDLALRGFAVVNFTYHLIPEYRYPRFFKDTVSAFRFVYDNKEKYGFDIDHVYGVGDSAGAHILSQYCIYGTNEEYRKKMNIDETFFLKPKAVGLNCGIYSFHSKKEIKLQRHVYGKDVPIDEILGLVNLLPYVNEDFPPSFIVSAPGDFLISQQPLLEDALNKAGVENELHIYGSSTNRLSHVFHCDIRNKEGIKANDEECGFFKRHI